jgi:hypothetical protein
MSEKVDAQQHDLRSFMVLLLGTTAVIGALLAIPIVSFYFILLTFGLGLIFFLTVVGLFALGGASVVLLMGLLASVRVVTWQVFQMSAVIWLAALMLHAGFSFGKSRWGDVASTMGMKNFTYAESFWQPYRFVRYGAKGLE